MIRPTMSHAVNKDELFKLMSDYATYLEGRKTRYSNRAVIAETRLREEEQENARLREEVARLDKMQRYTAGLFEDAAETAKELKQRADGFGKNIAEMSGLIRKEQDRAEKAEAELVYRVSDVNHLNAEITSLNEQLAYMRDMLDKVEAANYHEKLREAIQAERKRWAKEDAEALRVRDIEQQIKGVQIVLDCPELNLSQGEVDTLKLIKEQLRKELEK